MVNEFSAAQITSRIESMKNTGGTPEERAFARELSSTLKSSAGISLPDAEHQAWCAVLKSRMNQE